MKSIHVVLFFLFCSIYGQAQVGINTTSPDANSILHLKSNNKGLLIPRMNTVQREAMVSLTPAQGMMVYDTQLDVIFIFYSNKWYALNPWKTEYRTYNNSGIANMTSMTAPNINYGNVGIGVPNPTKKLEVKDAIKTDTIISVVVNAVSGNGITPLGGIIMWSGTKAPSGWALCNGLTVNGYKTPDLRGRFIVGYDNGVADYNNPGDLSTKGTTGSVDVGGAKEVVLTEAQMPKHNHTINDPGHIHATVPIYTHHQAFDNDDWDDWDYGVDNDVSTSKTSSSVTGITINVRGADAAHENRPPYYTLAYIMRVY